MASWSPDETERPTLNVWVRALLLVLASAALLWWLASPAYAHHNADATESPITGMVHEHECPAADEACLAITERLEWILTHNESILNSGQNAEGYLADIKTNTDSTGSPAEVAGVVALSEGDAQRLDLIWIGVFLMGGITFGYAIALWIKREQSKWGMDA